MVGVVKRRRRNRLCIEICVRGVGVWERLFFLLSGSVLMEDSTPVSGSFDKSRVMNVRPLRCLVPIFGSASAPNFPSFPNPQGGAPFVCVSPSGPFPPGAASFYPFFATPEPQRPPVPNRNAPISNAVPITSFRTPQAQYAGDENGETGSSRRVTRSRALSRHQSGDVQEDGQYSSSFSMHDSDDTGKAGRSKSSSRSQRKTRARQDINIASTEIDIDSVIENLLASSNIAAFDMIRRAEADKESVGCLLMIYDFIRRKINQIEESKDAVPGVTRRPDLRAGAILMNKGIRTNIKKRVGAVPGVEVGDCFFFRMELCLIGLHAPCMAGIDYMGLKVSQSEEPLAVSIVSSGGYEDDNMEDGGVLIYSGQGGNHFRKDKEVMDQKLERGNLALEKSLHRGNEIRVIRGFKDFANPTGKVYVYDGLYKIQESWVDKGKSGRNVFKYKLVRLPGQPEAFLTWKLIQQWKDGVNSRVGVILPDLTSGAESAPVSLVNDVDDEKGPAYFTYFPGLKNEKPVDPIEPCTGCNCVGGCLPGSNCSCIKKNEGYLPYNANSVLVNQKSLLYECGPSCQCPSNCRNRISQSGLRVRLEVFKTKDRGWGLRSWDPLRAGAFICEYAGEVIASDKLEELGSENEDDYIFDATRTYPLFELPGDSNEAPKIPHPLIISAKNAGNVGRFMNHSCSPNVSWQPILRENKNESDLHVTFHAVRHIPPMTELTYDYGAVPPEKADHRKKKCLCGSVKCKGYFY